MRLPLALLLALLAPLGATPESRRVAPDGDVDTRLAPYPLPRLQSPAAAVERALAAEAEVRERSGRARLGARLLAVDAWRAVRAEGDPRLGADAAMRAGRALSALQFVDEARAEYAFAAEHLRAADRHVARLELAHLERRAGHFAAALTAYHGVERDPLAPADARDEAQYWSARVHLLRGASEDARRVFRSALEGASDTVDRIRAGDGLALEAIARGDLGAAAGWIARTREVAFAASLERTPEGARVRSALARMRALVELSLAVEDGPPGAEHLFEGADAGAFGG